MEGKKKISLVAIICICVIVVLIIGMIFLYLKNTKLNKDKDETNANAINKEELTVNEQEFKKGKYTFKVSKELYERDGELWNDIEIDFGDNNNFKAYIGFENYIEGTYEKSNDIIECKVESYSGEYSEGKETASSLIKFEIKEDDNLEVINDVEPITAKITENKNGKWISTGETKKLSLFPFEKGSVFTLKSESNEKNTNTNSNISTEPAVDKDYKNEYSKYFEEYSKTISSNVEIQKYITDVDNDGIEELLIKTGTCEADSKVHFYTYKNGEVTKLGEITCSNTALYKMNNEDYILAVFGHMGYETTYKVFIKNGKVYKEEIRSREISADEEYTEGDKVIDFI